MGKSSPLDTRIFTGASVPTPIYSTSSDAVPAQRLRFHLEIVKFFTKSETWQAVFHNFDPAIAKRVQFCHVAGEYAELTIGQVSWLVGRLSAEKSDNSAYSILRNPYP